MFELLFLAAAIHTPPPVPTDPPPPTWTVTASDVEGYPTRFDWYVCQPGEVTGCPFYATGESFIFRPNRSGLWRITMVVRYAHEAAPGVRYVFTLTRAVHVGGLFSDDFEDGTTDLWTVHN